MKLRSDWASNRPLIGTLIVCVLAPGGNVIVPGRTILRARQRCALREMPQLHRDSEITGPGQRHRESYRPGYPWALPRSEMLKHGVKLVVA